MKKVEEETGGVPYAYVLGALDVKDAFLQVPQEEPAQVSAPNGIFEVKRNLPGQRDWCQSLVRTPHQVAE